MTVPEDKFRNLLYFFETGSLTKPDRTDWLFWLAGELSTSSCTEVHACHDTKLLCGCWKPNPCLHAYTASSFPAEPSLWCLLLFKHSSLGKASLLTSSPTCLVSQPVAWVRSSEPQPWPPSLPSGVSRRLEFPGSRAALSPGFPHAVAW